jgi:hypothetical protein
LDTEGLLERAIPDGQETAENGKMLQESIEGYMIKFNKGVLNENDTTFWEMLTTLQQYFARILVEFKLVIDDILVELDRRDDREMEGEAVMNDLPSSNPPFPDLEQ